MREDPELDNIFQSVVRNKIDGCVVCVAGLYIRFSLNCVKISNPKISKNPPSS